MTATPEPSAAVTLVSCLAIVVTVFILLGLVLAGIMAFNLVAGGTGPENGFGYLFITTWLLVLGVIAVIVGGFGMVMARGAQRERRRCWHAIAFGLVALFMGATFGVGFV